MKDRFSDIRNGEGYMDLTAYRALKRAEEDEKRRMKRFLDIVYSACDLAGFILEERIVVRDRRTGRVWE